MKFNNFKILANKRRGLSSIVGALLFVVLMVAAFAVLGVALDSQTDIVSTSRDIAAVDLKKQQEDYELVVFADAPVGLQAEIHIEVRNEGQNPVEIFTVVVAEITDDANDFPSTVYDDIPADFSFIPPGAQQEISPPGLILLDLAVLPVTEEFYTIKVISSLGTIKPYTIVCDENKCGDSGVTPGAGSLVESLFLDGPNAVNTKISTIIMFVVNNSDDPVTDVQPFRGFGIANCNANVNTFWTETVPQPGGVAETITGCDIDPSVPVDLPGHAFAIFKWDVIVGGDVDAEFQFCNYATGTGPLGPITSLGDGESCDEVTIINPNDCGGADCDTGGGGPSIILVDDLLIRPSIFMIVPSPWGDAGTGTAGGKGVWGINIVNPTERPMSVNKVTIVAYPPGANSNDGIIPGGCAIEAISPIDANWECPRINTIMWEDILNPVPVPAYESVSFLAKLEPGSPSGNINVDAIIVQANAFTTAGSFGKAAYQSTMFTDPEVIANVYLTDLDNSTANANIQSQRLGLTELVPEEFKITMADMDSNDDTYFKKDFSQLIINVPRQWTDVCITGDTGFKPNGTPDPDCTIDDRITFFSDQSHQIIAVADVDVGGDIDNTDLPDALTLTFTATPPLNDEDGTFLIPERLYIMYVLLDGQTGHIKKGTGGDPDTPDPAPLGALNEIAIQVLHNPP